MHYIFEDEKSNCIKKEIKILPKVNIIGYGPPKDNTPTKFEYVENQSVGDFVATLIQDLPIKDFIEGKIQIHNGKIIADLHESRRFNKYHAEVYELVYQNYHMFDRILTHDIELLTLPNSVRRFLFHPLLGTYHNQGNVQQINSNMHQLYLKTKNISCIASNRAFLQGQRIRLALLDNLDLNKVDRYGNGINHLQKKIDGLKDYRFSIAIENDYMANYATEKILDCLLVGTIPIYYGCPNISSVFDINGIYTFETKDELFNIIDEIHTNGAKIYKEKKQYIKNNFITACNMWLNADRYYDFFIKDLIE